MLRKTQYNRLFKAHARTVPDGIPSAGAPGPKEISMAAATSPSAACLALAAVLAASSIDLAAPTPAPAADGSGSPAAVFIEPPKPQASGAPDPVGRLTVASRLAEEARRLGSPLALAAAADLMASTRTREVARSKSTVSSPGGDSGEIPETAADPSPGMSTAPAGPTGPREIFSEAVALARTKGDEPLARALESLAPRSLRTRRPKTPAGESHNDRIRPHSTDIYVVSFPAGATARATVVTNSGQDVDLFVFDMEGKIVAYDNGLETVGSCTWVPETAAEYSLRVINTSGFTVDYTLFTG
ncbi:MAG: hypothetical protein LBT40_04090 [Deltaproteobacteria bacterium]|jgi:hypothetical protein|nr:hypothetical protein [Deltaproteobacteria bacterium]